MRTTLISDIFVINDNLTSFNLPSRFFQIKFNFWVCTSFSMWKFNEPHTITNDLWPLAYFLSQIYLKRVTSFWLRLVSDYPNTIRFKQFTSNLIHLNEPRFDFSVFLLPKFVLHKSQESSRQASCFYILIICVPFH